MCFQSWRVAIVAACIVASAAHAQRVYTDIVYESPGSTRNVLDVIVPPHGQARGQVTIVYVHGGGWSGRDKADDMAVYLRLARRGYSIVACNYTLAASGSPSFPQAVQDVKNAVRWVRTEGHDYNLPQRIVIFGPSSGGHLAMMVAVTSGDSMFETLSPPLGGYRPDAFISFAGFSDLEWHVQQFGQEAMFMRFTGEVYGSGTAHVYQAASPITHVSPCDPPGAFIHGDADTVVPHEHSLMMAEALRAQHKFTSTRLVQDAGHTYEPFGGQSGIADRIAEKIEILMPYTRTADLDGDGQLTSGDFDTFLQLFDARDPRADINRDGRFDVSDFIAFMELFVRGC